MGRTDLFADYDAGANFCEVTGRSARPDIGELQRRLSDYSLRALTHRNRAAERELKNLGITFTVYSEAGSIDRILPFDPIPRPISRRDWDLIERGCIQRVRAINAFLADVYGRGRIFKDEVIPPELVLKNRYYRPEMAGFKLARDVYAHISGIDLIRDETGKFLVLEDNCRSPSGVSYVIENRHLMMRSFPDLMAGMRIEPVSDYGRRLKGRLIEIAPPRARDPQVVLLTPGVYNSAYFEHVFLAREMGVPLVEGRDLFVEDDRVFMKSVAGIEPVHVIYRRIDDDFLDPDVFRKDSALGVRGLMRAYRAGNVSIANAVGTGVADDKAVYAYMPRIISYYLSEAPILENVETHICREPAALRFVLENLENLVVKPVGESGGYGIVIGPKSNKKELADVRAAVKRNPENYVAQPMVSLSVCPTLTKTGIGPRHVDLRPFVLTGAESWVLPGGLTRVAMREGSLIVNSSQGGGSKDTWVMK